jgi:hypothetical protein
MGRRSRLPFVFFQEHQTMKTDEARARIRALNDSLRRTRKGGMIVATTGINAMGREAIGELLDAISAFDAFTPDNDPHQEHDFGSLEIRGAKVFWKMDYFSLSGEYASPDPADPRVTKRVMTIMLAEEY